LNVLADKIGKDKFMNMLKDASSKLAAEDIKKMAANSPSNDLAAFSLPLKKPNHFWKHALTTKIIKDTPKELRIQVTECIWAMTFHKLKSQDIGYAIICHPDFAMAPAFNPKLKMLRTKTLMQGHECCNHHWIMEG
jgi:hypothetical protein